MATIKDIAKLAGVGQGTVSNVLNGRANVSSDKIRRVLDACQQLNYVPDERAKSLRRGDAKLLGFLMPDLTTASYTDIYRSFRTCAESHGYTVRQYIPSAGTAEAEEEAIQAAKSDMVSGLAVLSNNLHLRREDLSSFAEEGLRLLFVEQKPSFPAPYIGFDFEQAGRDVAARLKNEGYHRVLLLTRGAELYSDSEFEKGFLSVLSGSSCKVSCLRTAPQYRHRNLLQASGLPQAQVIVCTQFEVATAVKDILENFYFDTLPVLCTLSSLFTFPHSDYIKYELNYRRLGNIAAKKLIRYIETQQAPGTELLENTGFREWFPACVTPPAEPVTINMATLDTPVAEIVRKMSRLYTRQTGVRVNITVFSYDETFEVYNSLRDSSVFDVLRLDVTGLDWFADKILMPLEEIDPSVTSLLPTFLDRTVERYSYVNGRLYALPASPSTQILFYRSDLFESSIYRRLFYEQNKTELTVPKSFDEFNRVARFFTRSFNPDSPVEYGATLTLGSTGVAGTEFLTRLFALQDNLYDANGCIILNSPPAIHAMEQLVELRDYSSPAYCSWWTNTAETFAAGNVAMAILYNNFAAPMVNSVSAVPGKNIGYAIIPGGRPNIGGGTIGVSRYSRHPEEALRFIRWLCSEPVATASTVLGSVSPCKASYENFDIINTYPWLKISQESFLAAEGHRLPPSCPGPFDERGFLSIIGMAVKNAWSGAMHSEEALNAAQQIFAEKYPLFTSR